MRFGGFSKYSRSTGKFYNYGQKGNFLGTTTYNRHTGKWYHKKY